METKEISSLNEDLGSELTFEELEERLELIGSCTINFCMYSTGQ